MIFPVIPMLFRARAREVLKKNLSTALMVSFLAALPGLLVQVYRSIASRDLLEVLRYHLLTLADAYQKGVADSELMTMLHTAGTELLQKITPDLQLSWWLSIAAALVTPVLSLGLIAHLLKLVRGQTGEMTDVISRLGCFFKAILQNILIAVKLILWTLPGIALSVFAMTTFFMSNGKLGMMLMLYSAGFAVSTVLMIRAALHYSMSSIILADEPSTSAWASIRRSIDMMRTHKMDFARVYLSFILWNIAASWISTMLGAIIPVLGTMSSLAFQLVLGLYVNTTIVVFYLNLKGEISMVPKNGGFAELERMMREQTGQQGDDNDDDNNDDMLN